MGDWQTRAEIWLAREQMGDDEAAEAAFAHAFRALPTIASSGDFVQRAVAAAWRSRAQRRSAWAAGTIAASILFAALTAGTIYSLFGLPGIGRVLTTSAMAAASLVSSLLVAGSVAATWWIATADLGRSLAELLAVPQATAAFAGVALVGVAALSAMRRALGTAWEIR